MADFVPKQCLVQPPTRDQTPQATVRGPQLQAYGNAAEAEQLASRQGGYSLQDLTDQIAFGTGVYTLATNGRKALDVLTMAGRFAGHAGSIAHNLGGAETPSVVGPAEAPSPSGAGTTPKEGKRPQARNARKAKAKAKRNHRGKNKNRAKAKGKQRALAKQRKSLAKSRAKAIKGGAPNTTAPGPLQRAKNSVVKGGRAALKGGKTLAGKTLRGAKNMVKDTSGKLNVLGGIASGIDAGRNSKHDGARAVADGTLNGSLNTFYNFTPAGVVTAAESLFAPDAEHRNMTGLINATSGMVSAIGNGQAANEQIEANRSGERGVFVQTLTEHGERASDCTYATAEMFGGPDTLLGDIAAWAARPACLSTAMKEGTAEGLVNVGSQLAEGVVDAITAEPDMSPEQIQEYQRWNTEVACPMQGCHSGVQTSPRFAEPMYDPDLQYDAAPSFELGGSDYEDLIRQLQTRP